jgi:L-threonylcarbamoyladenylate synthase
MIDNPSRSPLDHAALAADAHLLPIAPGERRLLVLDPTAPQAIEWTADRLVSGGVVSFPTDTVYALAASLAHPDALDRIFALKGRPPGKPLPILLAAAADLHHMATAIDPRVVTLAARYWPGPLTIVVPTQQALPSQVVGRHHSVGLRVPNHFLALELIERAGGVIAATSANKAGRPPATTADEVAAAFGDDLDIVLDGGPVPQGVPSTVVQFTGTDLRELRQGAIPFEHLLSAWREILDGAGAH